MDRQRRLVNYLIILLIIIIPVACILLFLLPDEIKQLLMLRSGDWNPLTFFTSIFIHLNQLHLVSNIISFLVISNIIYMINWKTSMEKKILKLMLLTIILIPFIYNILFNIVTTFILHDSFISCGLSTAVAGLTGLTIPSLRVFLTEPIQNSSTSNYFSMSLTLLTISIITVSRILELLFLTIFIITLACSLILILKIQQPITTLIKKDLYMKLRFLVTILALVIYYTLVYLLFPANIVTLEGSVIDVLAHLTGLFAGIGLGTYILNFHKT
ncbi:MAG: hypothetical protein QW327_04315 [Candidatus Odinarchaeota archaeon]